ncbi:MAG TPA: VWA domain-containing protein [Planctomycetaceae bacterium]|nr:VWA domain-containing protein [Planctomycetaceae bacterium]
MTSIRFVGDLPLWLGLLLAVVASALSWRYYRREQHDLSPRLRWLLPLLRSFAFFLAVLALAGPVLHHRTIIGELGRVLIYLDGSQSMAATDEHMSVARKLLVVQQQGWLSKGDMDVRSWELAEELAAVREETVQTLQGELLNAETWEDCRNSFVERLEAVQVQWRHLAGNWDDHREPAEESVGEESNDVRQRFETVILEPARKIDIPQPAPQGDAEDAEEIGIEDSRELLQLCQKLLTFESVLRRDFEAMVNQVVATDESVRLALARFDATPRWRRGESGLLRDEQGVVNQLKKTHDVQILTLDEETANSKWDGRQGTDFPQELLEQASGSLTNLASGVSAATIRRGTKETGVADAETGQRTAVILVSDGQHNSGPSPLQIAKLLGQQGIPIYPIGMGSRLEPPDLAILDLQYPDVVFQKDDIRGEMTIRDRIPRGRPFVIEVRHQDEVLWRKELVTQDTLRRRVEFEFPVEELVERLQQQFDSEMKQHTVPLALEASIVPLDEENEVANNSAMMRLAAITQSYRILVIDGRSRWETRYLRNAFQRDSQWKIETLIVGPGTDDLTLPRGETEGTFPTDRERLFAYDLIVFGEVVPDVFADHELVWIREFVELRGGGLLLLDGQRNVLSSYPENFTALFPISWNGDVIQVLPDRLRLTERGANEAAFRLAVDKAENRILWNELPPPHKLSCVDALPDAEVLLEITVNDEIRPAMVMRAFGAGRVLYSAFDETWRWRYKVADTYHQRFWNQLAKTIMARPFAVSDEFAALDTGAASYSHGEMADIRVRLTGLDGRPATGVTVDALLWKDGQIISTVSLDPDGIVDGIYRGRTGALEQGEYEVSIQASGYSQEVLKARTQFVVEPPETGELQQTACNEELLRSMAASSGGQFLSEEQFTKVVSLLRPLSSGEVVESDTLLWQSYWWFAAILGLLATEWMLRKRAGLL